MSTRCNIIVKDDFDAIQLYRHCDGYPDSEHGVINDLKKALDYAWPLPRMEAADLAAAIVAAWKKNSGNIYIDGTAKIPETLHGDIEYCYTIKPDKNEGKWRVKCRKCRFHPDGNKPSETVFDGFIGDNY